jgi:acyl carrier protein
MTDLEAQPNPIVRTEQEIAQWLRDRIAALLEIDAAGIRADEPFESYGLGSSDAVFLTGGLSEFLGLRLSATVAWDYSTIDELSAFLAAGTRGEAELPDDMLDWDLDADFGDVH